MHNINETIILGVPVNGGWGKWTKWSSCSEDCGGGYKVRTRKCDDPKPKAGGKKCHGPKVQRLRCNVKACPGLYSCRNTFH